MRNQAAVSPPLNPATTLSVLMVCMGNICRSPTAHGVLLKKLQDRGLQRSVTVDSAGTHSYHTGEPPDTRAQRHAAARGYDLSTLRARSLSDEDFFRFDLILVMDWDNLALTEQRCPDPHKHKIRRLSEFAMSQASPVIPDPYYGPPNGFDTVLDLIEDASDGLVTHLEQRIRRTSNRV